MWRMGKVLPLVLMVVLLMQTAVFAEGKTADFKTLYYNAEVYTNDETVPAAEAIVVENGKFAFVGSYQEALAFAGDDCEKVDLQGQFVSPSFFDSHVHLGLQQGAFDFRDYIADETPTIAQYVAALKEYLAENPDIEYLRGAGWDNTSFPNGSPAKEILDEINDEIPIALRSLDYHSLWVNSKALELAGITAETKVPDDKGTIDLNEKGEVGGALRELAAMDLVLSKLPPITIDEYKASILKTQDLLLGYGVTGVFDAYVMPDSNWYRAYRELADDGELRMHVSIAIGITADQYETQIEWVKNEVEKYRKLADEKLMINACKFLADGVVEGGTAYLEEEYSSQPGYTGIPIWEKSAMAEAFKLCDQYGIKTHVHAVGDAAVAMTLDCLEGLSTDHRNAICHLQLVNDADFQRFADLGVVAVVAPYWVFRSEGYEELEVRFLGEERVERTYPVKTFLDYGVSTAAHSDYPVTAIADPLEGIEIAVTRSRPASAESELPNEDFTLNAKEAITVEQAIDVFTYQGAYANFMEDITGSITVGKSADFVVINQNILQTPASLASVVATYFEGELVFSK